MQPITLNPDTHCTSCGEVLSTFHHCWQCYWPPMDPGQTPIAPSLTQADTSADVHRAGLRIGTVHCIDVAPTGEPRLKWYGRNLNGSASGQAHATQAQAEQDVADWADGKEVAYVKLALTKTTTVAAKPHHIPCGQCGACYANESCGLLQPQATPAK